ncbi:hypothetical protein [Laspinema palackyanum]
MLYLYFRWFGDIMQRSPTPKESEIFATFRRSASLQKIPTLV